MITPFWCQLPPPPLTTGVEVMGDGIPPAADIFTNVAELERKAIHWPSGDQMGSRAPSVPSSARGSDASRERSQILRVGVPFSPAKAIVRPSGETLRL